MKELKKATIVGNWKMYKTIGDAQKFIRELQMRLLEDAIVYLAVPFTAIHAASVTAKNTRVIIGAQNMHDRKEGPYTGEVSAVMLKEAGAEFVILGHSERRYLFGEGNRFINHKIKSAFEENLKPILCVGETGHEREKGLAEEVLEEQISYCLDDIEESAFKNLMLAYEPVWAIGTGKTASPEEAEERHFFCRNLLKKRFGDEISKKIPILYGGSVKPDNVQALLGQTNINGVLVGGASLDVDTFSQIANYQTIKVSVGGQ